MQHHKVEPWCPSGNESSDIGLSYLKAAVAFNAHVNDAEVFQAIQHAPGCGNHAKQTEWSSMSSPSQPNASHAVPWPVRNRTLAFGFKWKTHHATTTKEWDAKEREEEFAEEKREFSWAAKHRADYFQTAHRGKSGRHEVAGEISKSACHSLLMSSGYERVRSKGHSFWKASLGNASITLASTPSDCRSLKNTAADIRRALRDAQEGHTTLYGRAHGFPLNP
jgi:hypothetical protein